MRKLKGFTLIELMIVVAIIAILAAIAFPAYQNYVVRARVVEGLALLTDAKTTVIENTSSGRPFAQGFSFPSPTKSVSSIGIDADTGLITISMKPNAGDGTVEFLPSPPLVSGTPPAGRVEWTCLGGTLSQRFRPAECRS